MENTLFKDIIIIITLTAKNLLNSAADDQENRSDAMIVFTLQARYPTPRN